MYALFTYCKVYVQFIFSFVNTWEGLNTWQFNFLLSWFTGTQQEMKGNPARWGELSTKSARLVTWLFFFSAEVKQYILPPPTCDDSKGVKADMVFSLLASLLNMVFAAHGSDYWIHYPPIWVLIYGRPQENDIKTNNYIYIDALKIDR